jgi:hypothetical protein
MLNAQQSTEPRNRTLSPLLMTEEDRQRFHRRFDRVALGFWLGGAGVGTAGCIFGACLPNHHPVAVAVSVLWWGIYLGCLGASIGALFGLMTERHPPPPSRHRQGAGTAPVGKYNPALPAGSDDLWGRYGEDRLALWTAKSDRVTGPRCADGQRAVKYTKTSVLTSSTPRPPLPRLLADPVQRPPAAHPPQT